MASFFLLALAQTNGTTWRLLYGIGVRADRQLRLGQWANHVLGDSGIERWTVALSDSDAEVFAATSEQPTFLVGPPQTERIVQGGLIPRTAVYTTHAAVTSPQSFTGRGERIRSWTLQEKRQLCADVQQSLGGEDAFVRLLKRLSIETGVSFLNEDCTRFGNLELCEVLTGDYSSPGAIQVSRLEQTSYGWRIGAQVVDAAARSRVTSARLRVRAVSPFENGAILLDRLFLEPGGDFQAELEELPGTIEAQWYDSAGGLVDLIQFKYFLGVGMTIQIPEQETDALPPALRGELATPVSAGSLLDQRPQPWLDGERQAAAFRAHLFPVPDPDFHTFATEREHRAFVKAFILKSNDARRIIIADPYLDAGVISEYVLRDRGRLQCNLTLVLSTTPKEANVIRNLCLEFAYRLPSSCSVINLPRHSRQGMFHDRFALIGEGESLQVWHLGSSINSYSRQYPLFAARARGVARNAWSHYVEGLTRGELSDARSIEPEVLFRQIVAPQWDIPTRASHSWHYAAFSRLG